MEKENIVMDYISVWGWHLMAIIFLVSALIIVSLASNLFGDVFFVAFMFAFVMCEIISYTRRKSLEVTKEILYG